MQHFYSPELVRALATDRQAELERASTARTPRRHTRSGRRGRRQPTDRIT